MVERLLECLGLHHLGVDRGARVDRIDTALDAVLVYMNDQVEIKTPRRLVAELDHFAKLPRGVHVQQRKRKTRRMKGLQRQMQHHAGIFADRVEHHRISELGSHLPKYLDRFRLQRTQMLGKEAHRW